MSRQLRLALGLLAAVLLAGVPGLVVAHAQTPTPAPNPLTAQLLPADALPGWVAASDLSTTTSQGLTLAERVFTPVNKGHALIGVALLLPPNGASIDAVASQIQDGTLLQDLATGATQNSVEDFTLTGSQGIGEQDQSATFTGTLGGIPLQFAGEMSVRNGMIAFVIYGEDATAIDAPTALGYAANVAQMEDAVLLSTASSSGSTTE
jgi:hypothetical protein